MTEDVEHRIVTLADAPGLAAQIHEMADSWPPFMKEDPSGWNLGALMHLHPRHHVVALDGDRVVAFGRSAPFPWSGDPADLPAQGWDDVVGRAVRSACGGRPPTAVSALEVSIDPAMQGRGLSGRLLVAMRDAAARAGFRDMVAPVRPSAKHLEPRTPMAEYVARRREDGLPADPWLRVHVRLGATIVGVCAASMAIAAPLADWRRWTGLRLDVAGEVDVPGALVPLVVSLERDTAVYVEPNVWVHHRL